MSKPAVVSREEWLDARKAHLAREKELTRLRDAVSEERRALPWVKVDADYRFQGASGEQSLDDLFEGRSQLIVYHFMFDPSWEAGCKSCSYLADHFNPAIVHLNQKNITMLAVSRAPLATLDAYKARMGWSFRWVSSQGSTFNYDFGVSFTEEEKRTGRINYNFTTSNFFSSEAPGISAFIKDENGDIFHTYSSYSRGLDRFITAYTLMDISPRGRDEPAEGYTMGWLRRRDEYEG